MMRGSQHVKRPKGGGGGDGISQVVGSKQPGTAGTVVVWSRSKRNGQCL